MTLLNDELEDFYKLMNGIIIPGIIRIADNHKIDRDSMVKYTADTLTVMSELATFENWGGTQHDD